MARTFCPRGASFKSAQTGEVRGICHHYISAQMLAASRVEDAAHGFHGGVDTMVLK